MPQCPLEAFRRPQSSSNCHVVRLPEFFGEVVDGDLHTGPISRVFLSEKPSFIFFAGVMAQDFGEISPIVNPRVDWVWEVYRIDLGI